MTHRWMGLGEGNPIISSSWFRQTMLFVSNLCSKYSLPCRWEESYPYPRISRWTSKWTDSENWVFCLSCFLSICILDTIFVTWNNMDNLSVTQGFRSGCAPWYWDVPHIERHSNEYLFRRELGRCRELKHCCVHTEWVANVYMNFQNYCKAVIIAPYWCCQNLWM